MQNAQSILRQAWAVLRKAIESERVRRYRAALFQIYVLVALIVFAVLAFLASTNPYFAFDLAATLDLQSELPPAVLPLMLAISWPGYAVQAVVLMALVALALAVLGLRWEAAAALFAGSAAGILNTIVKLAIRRPRPDETLVEVFGKLDTYSFPSGHVMFYVAFFGFLLFLSFVLIRRRLWRWLAYAFLVALVVGVGFSRIYLGDHWASDVIGGYLLGSLVLLAAIVFYRWGKRRVMPDQPVAPVDPNLPEPNPVKERQPPKTSA